MPGKCARCDGRLERTTTERVQDVARRRFVATVPARACRVCGAVYVAAASLERVELAVACELAVHGPATGETFRYMRKALGMRASDLASLLGVTPETVSRWENEQRPVDGPTWITLGSLVLEKARRASSTLDRLRAMRDYRAPPRTRATRIDP
jgi:DNA-binding transcriptional regulator YiaG